MLELDPTLRRILRDNTGQRLHILIVLLAASVAVTIREIASVLNVSERNVGDLLQRLKQDGYAARVNSRWIATAKAQQFAFPQMTLLNGIEARQSGLQPPEFSTSVEKDTEKFSDPVVVVDQDLLALADQQQQQSAPIGKNFRSDAETQRLRVVFDEFQVLGKKRRALLADDWVTVHKFSTWQAIAELAGLDNPVGYAIVRCENHDEPPTIAPAEEKSVAAQWNAIIKKARNP